MMLLANVAAFGRRPGAGIAARWTTASTPSYRSSIAGQRLDDLAEVGEVDPAERAARSAPGRARSTLTTSYPCVAQVRDDGPAELAAATGDDDPRSHGSHAFPSVVTDARLISSRADSRCLSRFRCYLGMAAKPDHIRGVSWLLWTALADGVGQSAGSRRKTGWSAGSGIFSKKRRTRHRSP